MLRARATVRGWMRLSIPSVQMVGSGMPWKLPRGGVKGHRFDGQWQGHPAAGPLHPDLAGGEQRPKQHGHRRGAGLHFHRQADRDGAAITSGRPPAFARWRGFACHGEVESDHQRTTALQRLVAGRPGPGLAGRGAGRFVSPGYHFGFTRGIPHRNCASEPFGEDPSPDGASKRMD